MKDFTERPSRYGRLKGQARKRPGTYKRPMRLHIETKNIRVPEIGTLWNGFCEGVLHIDIWGVSHDVTSELLWYYWDFPFVLHKSSWKLSTVQRRKWSPTANDPQMDRKWSRTAKDPRCGPQMIPAGKRRMAWSLVSWIFLFLSLFIFIN